MNFAWTDVIFLLFAGAVTPEVSPRLILFISTSLKKIYRSNNETEDENVIFSCWGGTYDSKVAYLIITFFLILNLEASLVYKEPRLIFFAFVALVFLFILCWNSLCRIEITREGIGLYRMQFGTDTQIYYIKNKYIKSIYRELTVGDMFSGGLNSWLVVNLKKGRKILFPPPNTEDCEILFGFLENQQVPYEIKTDLTPQK